MAWWLHVRAAPHVTVMDYGFGWVSWRAWELQVWKQRPGDIQSTLEAFQHWSVASWFWFGSALCLLEPLDAYWDVFFGCCWWCLGFCCKDIAVHFSFIRSSSSKVEPDERRAFHSAFDSKRMAGALSGRWRKYVDLMESLSCRWHHNSGWTESCHLVFPIAVFAVTIRC